MFFFRNFEKLFTYLNFPLGFEYECMDEYEMWMCTRMMKIYPIICMRKLGNGFTVRFMRFSNLAFKF